jgi:SAM-dependent methyltransferase
MISSFDCPICKKSDWQNFSSYEYKKQIFPPHTVQKPNEFRNRVLFELWFPDVEEIRLNARYCTNCGFVCYSPRPTNEDLQLKYEFLGKREKIGSLNKVTARALRLQNRRAKFVFDTINHHAKGKLNNILDVGGGDGRLLKLFLKDYECYVVDFNPSPIAGVKRIASTLDELKTNEQFDIIICSHVLEHVADPVELLTKIRLRLSEKGVLYIEVPVEVWKGIPIQKAPVTHVNFFTKESLEVALSVAGFRTDQIKYDYSPYDNRYKRVAWAVASKGKPNDKLYASSLKKTGSLINPGLATNIYRLTENIWLNLVLNTPLFFKSMKDSIKRKVKKTIFPSGSPVLKK